MPVASRPNINQKNFGIVKDEFIIKYKRVTDQYKSGLSVGIDGCKGKWIAFEAGVGWQSKNINRRDSLNSLIKKLSEDFGLKYDDLKCEKIITEYSDRIKKLEQG